MSIAFHGDISRDWQIGYLHSFKIFSLTSIFKRAWEIFDLEQICFIA